MMILQNKFRFIILGLAALIGLLALAVRATPIVSAARAPVTTHPRLWLTQNDLPRLRGWANSGNPIYEQGLKPLVLDYKTRMDNGTLYTGDGGCNWCYVSHPVEWGAQLFAFMSLIEPQQSTRDEYGNRARTLLMHIMNQAVLGPTAADSNYRGANFSTNMRSLFYADAFPLTVDWIYPYLSASDKQTIRTVFLRWQNENLVATTTGYDHPEPVWTLNNPILLSEPYRFRTATNNFYLTHMNQIGLMALAFDAADDPGDANDPDDQVRDFLPNAIGAWLYVHHELSKSYTAGAFPAEGAMYGPTGASRAAMFMFALYTAGQADTNTWGAQVNFDDAFWQTTLPAHLHMLPPTPSILPGMEYLGPVYIPADHGDAQDVWEPDMMSLMGMLGLYAQATGNTARYDATRWVETHIAPGGASKLITRAGDFNHARDCILYFMLFDPAASAPSDPRPTLPLDYFSPGIGRILSRTGWNANASFFAYHLGWNLIDHQHQTGNMVEFFRKGEWLTKQWSGYGYTSGASDYKNTLTLQNNSISTGLGFWAIDNARGSQYAYIGPSGDPNLLAHSFNASYTYALGDATNLYNLVRPSINATDIAEATRSVVWLKPDVIVIYDRAVSNTSGRFKRFWLNLPTSPIIANKRATMTTTSGQKLVVDTLLPADATLAINSQLPDAQGWNETATGEPMHYRLLVQSPSNPANARFLHVLQGLDAGATPNAPAFVTSSSGTAFAGALIGDAVVMFPVNVGHIPTGILFNGINFAGTSYTVPLTIQKHFITGLTPNAKYNFAFQNVAGNLQVTVSAGTQYQADSGGVLSYPATLPDWRWFLPFIVR